MPFRKARKVRWLAALDKKPLANRIGTKMNNEPQVVCRPVRFERQTPVHLRNIPFAEDRDYIRATRLDKWVALALGVAVLIVIGLDSAWLMGWLK